MKHTELTKALTNSQFVALVAASVATAGGATVAVVTLWRFSPRFRRAQAQWATWEAVRAADRLTAEQHARFRQGR
tara:strand:- start:393 stop:617 length:225 start_codon:yes stop_codon:yes gene_type:complete